MGGKAKDRRFWIIVEALFCSVPSFAGGAKATTVVTFLDATFANAD